MKAALAALRSNRALVASVAAASVALTALALVGIGVMLGWIPRETGGAKPPGPPAAAKPKPATSAGVDLLPGETLVSPPDAPAARTEPWMPHYSAPTPPPGPPRPAKEEAPGPPPLASRREPAPRPAQPRPAPDESFARDERREAQRRAARAAPSTPSFARGGSHPTSPLDTWPNPPPCDACGTVTTITAYPDLWEVRVRFEDGSIRYMRYRAAPPLRVGDPVRFVDGRLLPD